MHGLMVPLHAVRDIRAEAGVRSISRFTAVKTGRLAGFRPFGRFAPLTNRD
jgi:hypothetical protein